MPYSSYSNYLEYKNCKRDTVPCNNNFDSYKKYNKSLNCCRAWWSDSTLKRQVFSSPCNVWPPIQCQTLGLDKTIAPEEKNYCSSIDVLTCD